MRLLLGRRRLDSLADCCQQLPSARWAAAPLANDKAGFRPAFCDDVCDKVVKQPLHTCAGGSRRAKQRLVP